MDVLATEVRDEFARLHDRMRAVIKDLDMEALNRAPAEGENSIAILVTHVLGSELGWLHRAAGRPFTRDRDSEFRARRSATELRAAIDATEPQVRELLDATIAGGLDTKRPRGDGTEVTAAFCVTYILSHSAEHVGHAELTRNLLGHRPK